MNNNIELVLPPGRPKLKIFPVQLEIRINVFKYYHAANSDHYNDLSAKEKSILLNYLNTNVWTKYMNYSICSRDDTILNVEYIELPINGKKRLHAIVNIKNI